MFTARGNCREAGAALHSPLRQQPGCTHIGSVSSVRRNLRENVTANAQWQEELNANKPPSKSREITALFFRFHFLLQAGQ